MMTEDEALNMFSFNSVPKQLSAVFSRLRDDRSANQKVALCFSFSELSPQKPRVVWNCARHHPVHWNDIQLHVRRESQQFTHQQGHLFQADASLHNFEIVTHRACILPPIPSTDKHLGERNVNYSETEEHKIKPHKLRNLRDHECVIVHCERGFKKVVLPPLEPDGTVASWFRRTWF